VDTRTDLEAVAKRKVPVPGGTRTPVAQPVGKSILIDDECKHTNMDLAQDLWMHSIEGAYETLLLSYLIKHNCV
jgi:hypothetical protein